MAKILWSELNDPEKWADTTMPLAAAVCSSPELAAEFAKRWNAYEELQKLLILVQKVNDEWLSCHPFGHEDAMRELAAILARHKTPVPDP